jgi:hypothetical protein
VQALIPTIEFRVLMVVSASDCNHRQYESESSVRRTPNALIHFTPILAFIVSTLEAQYDSQRG